MFVGHYSASFLGKAAAPRVPLWIFVLAAQLVDVAWAIFILTGIERFHLDPTLPSNPLVLDHMPYTHSLVATLAWATAAAIAVIAAGYGSTRAAFAVAAVVTSHWLLDVLVHRPDMTITGGDPKLGLGLWNQPTLAFALEVLFLAGAAAIYTTTARPDEKTRRAVFRGVLILIALQTATTYGPIPPSPTALVLSVLTTFLVVTWLTARAERGLRN
jgi:hypothetical protein